MEMDNTAAALVSAGIQEAAAKVGPSVVRVEAQGARGSGVGSGVLVDAAAGEIVTNAHVVHGQSEVAITFHDGITRGGQVLALDRLYDLALVRTQSPVREAVSLATRAELRPGQLVLAVGNPFGFDWTVTLGVVSAVERMLGPLDGLVQTDAAINPGNSGGALTDLEGRLVGIPTMILAQGQNLGFAIPTWQVELALGQFRRLGRAQHPWIGIRGTTEVVSPELAQLLELPAARGVATLEVEPGGPADAAGLLPFDVITAAGGEKTPSIAALRRVVRGTEVGDRLVLSVLRHGELQEASIRVRELPPVVTR
ncbi:MAG: trypsin-like peptidase domain-containing protein [Thermaerobacter sp.]|nr:trypsin-like peptidase domain-containing protein [Thermaerobacter sp.]